MKKKRLNYVGWEPEAFSTLATALLLQAGQLPRFYLSLYCIFTTMPTLSLSLLTRLLLYYTLCVPHSTRLLHFSTTVDLVERAFEEMRLWNRVVYEKYDWRYFWSNFSKSLEVIRISQIRRFLLYVHTIDGHKLNGKLCSNKLSHK